MSISLLQLIETNLAGHSPGNNWLGRFRKRSAVAMILRIIEGELHILMIKRAEREGDPWSGQMAFPGGRKDPTDIDDYAVAVRETEEEVGLLLGPDDQYMGRLSEVTARPRRSFTLAMTVSPFVFRLDREVSFLPNYEVAEVVWVPLEFLLDTDNRQEMVWESGKISLRLPCYFYQERRIWGLSLMMLDELMDLVEGKNPLRPVWRR